MELSAGWAELLAALFGLLASGMGTVLWFLFKSVREDARAAKADVESLKTDMANYKLYVAEHYVTQNELTKAVASLEKSIDRLIEAVDRSSRETRESLIQLQTRIDEKADKRPS